MISDLAYLIPEIVIFYYYLLLNANFDKFSEGELRMLILLIISIHCSTVVAISTPNTNA